MKLGEYLRPNLIAAPDDKVVKMPAFEADQQTVGNLFEMPHGFVLDVALVVSGVVSLEAVAAHTPWLRIHDLLALRHFTQSGFKDQRMLAVDDGNAGARRPAQQFDQRLEMKMRIHVEARFRKLRGKIEFAPEAIFAARKDSLGMGAVPAQLAPYRGDAVQVGAQTMIAIAVTMFLMGVGGL